MRMIRFLKLVLLLLFCVGVFASTAGATEKSSPRGVPPLDHLAAKRQAASNLGLNASTLNEAVAESYPGEYGWRLREYISSQLENDFFEDAKPYVWMDDWSNLTTKYNETGVAVHEQSQGAVFRNDPMDPIATATRCPAYSGATNSIATNASEGISKAYENRYSNECFDRQPELDPKLFSRFVYEFVCLGEPCTGPVPAGYELGQTHTSFIEPLWGSIRHPLFFVTPTHPYHLAINKQYMMIDKWALHNLHTRWRGASEDDLDRQSIFVDMGASTYRSGSGGASQNWFVGLAACMCRPFTDLYLYEATQHQPSNVWRVVPDYIIPRYHWYNYPLETKRSSWANPLNHLLSKRRRGDVVVMKVDFDSPKVEGEIISTLLDTPELFSIVDELFYEYHVKIPMMRQFWRTVMDENTTILQAIEVFREMRRRGIRAHAWV